MMKTKERSIAARKAQTALTDQALSREQFVISQYLRQVKFPPRLWGVDEGAVWRALEKLCRLYEEALITERAKRQLAERKLEALQSRLKEEQTDG